MARCHSVLVQYSNDVRANQTLPNPVLVDRGGDVHNTAHDCTSIAEHVGATRSVERYMALIGMKLRSEDGITSFKTACLERKTQRAFDGQYNMVFLKLMRGPVHVSREIRAG